MIINKIGTVKVKLCPDDDDSADVIEEEEEEACASSTELRLRSDATLNNEFFNNLWPLILDENRCHIKSKNRSIFFDPVQRFDRLWAHTLLAESKFKDYSPPTELRCIKKKPLVTKHTRPVNKCLKVSRPVIPTITEQIDAIDKEIKLGQQLSFEFIMRHRPWYMNKTIYDKDFEITDEMVQECNDKFMPSIAKAIQQFNCKLLIIDMVVDVTIAEMERWLPFCQFVKILVVARSVEKGRQLRALGDIFFVMDLEECLENTWQQELQSSLNASYQCAIECNLLETIASEFVFVFARERGFCKCDTYEVLCKTLEM